MAEKKQDPKVKRIHKDAEGQFAPKQHGGENDGVAGAKPRVIAESDDATVHPDAPEDKDTPKTWSANHDIRKNTNRR